MITCPVCGIENDELAVLCTSCKGYVQSKVENLDLFRTIWQLVEDPKTAFKKIILANHKNYVFLLSSLLGISIAFSFFWMKNLGPQFLNLLTLSGSAGLLGVPVGIAFVFAMSVVCSNISRILGRPVTVRNTASVVSYSGIPCVIALAFVMPIEMAVFGIDLFGVNPPPMVIDPIAYIALLAFDGLAVVWSILLLFRGLAVLTGFPKVRSLTLTGITLTIPGGLLVALKYL